MRVIQTLALKGRGRSFTHFCVLCFDVTGVGQGPLGEAGRQAGHQGEAGSATPSELPGPGLLSGPAWWEGRAQLSQAACPQHPCPVLVKLDPNSSLRGLLVSSGGPGSQSWRLRNWTLRLSVRSAVALHSAGTEAGKGDGICVKSHNQGVPEPRPVPRGTPASALLSSHPLPSGSCQPFRLWPGVSVTCTPHTCVLAVKWPGRVNPSL